MSFSARLVIAISVAAAALGCLPARAALAPDIVTAEYSGLAIGGYDPVTYFEHDARKGRPEYTAMWAGAAWQFANEGDMRAFLAAPEIYAPAFGGYCATSLARGERVEADPRLFVVHRGRVYLFYSRENRDAFLAAPDRFATRARHEWQALAPRAPAALMPAALPRQ